MPASDRWAAVEALFERVAELSPAERDAYLAQATDDPTLRAEVVSLLAHSAPDAAFIEAAISNTADLLTASEESGLVGRRVGPYQIAGIAGEGGMGAVYRAVRADGQFEQQVAIKLVHLGFETAAALDRFRQERSILARLEHPSIARLLDGGTLDAETGRPGVPYLVMEYVDGEPLTTYGATHRLSIADRVALFRRVCAAVQYAHQQLIIHRDLKPTNILVTKDGTPKLLDFGIAKLLDESDQSRAGRTSTGVMLMTPDYASPEQVRGEPVTVATDVYALGGVLYEFLTGHKSHLFANLSPVEVGRVIGEGTIAKPSAMVGRTTPGAARLSRQLTGDLDTIILKALRKEPARRYASVEQLSEDLQRYLEQRPVRARPDTVGYRASKLVRRNPVAVTAAALLVATLTGGVVATTREARARAAEAARAERRFQQVRTLANTFLFEFHDKIKDLPGATDARETVVRTALTYLDSLAREAEGDASLQMELAEAYRKVGDVQYDVRRASLGHAEAALDSYRKALTLSEKLAAREPTKAQHQRLLAESSLRVGLLLTNTGDHAGGVVQLRHGVEAAQAAVSADPNDPENAFTLSKGYDLLGVELLATRQLPAVLENFRLGLATVEHLATWLSNDRVQRALAQSHEGIAEVLVQMGDLSAAANHFGQDMDLRQSLADAHPAEPSYRMELGYVHQLLGDLLGSPVTFSLGDTRAAETHYRTAIAIGEALVHADPKDAQARLRLSILYRKLGNVTWASDPRQGLVPYRQAAAIVDALLAASPGNANYLRHQTLNDLSLARPLHAVGDHLAAMASARRALARQQAIMAKDPTRQSVRQDMIVTYHVIGDLDLDAGSFDAALDNYRQALTVSESVRAAAPADEYALRDLTDCYERLGAFWSRQAALRGLPPVLRRQRWQDARAWGQKSLTIWNDWTLHGPSNVYVTRRRDQAMRAVAQCDAALAKLSGPTTPASSSAARN